MCTIRDGFDGHKVQVCRVADLKPGDRYRTPDGGERMVVTPPATDGVKRVVDLTTGELLGTDPETRLGTDRMGRLYASRTLNQIPQADAAAVVVDTPDEQGIRPSDLDLPVHPLM